MEAQVGVRRVDRRRVEVDRDEPDVAADPTDGVLADERLEALGGGQLARTTGLAQGGRGEPGVEDGPGVGGRHEAVAPGAAGHGATAYVG